MTRDGVDLDDDAEVDHLRQRAERRKHITQENDMGTTYSEGKEVRHDGEAPPAAKPAAAKPAKAAKPSKATKAAVRQSKKRRK